MKLRRLVFGGVIMAALLLAVAGLLPQLNPNAAHAQIQCDGEDIGRVSFPVDYWDKTDFCQRSVDLSSIRSGGPPPDGIPPIDNPKFESIAVASEWLADESPVIALELNGEARAYPLAVLTWHEIANDEVGGVPVAVTFCPLCNASIVFDRRVGEDVLRLGVSGNLRNSDMVMWDDLTESWWQQLTGEAIVGSYTGTRLEFVPSTVIGFSQFAAEYPDGAVLSRDTGHSRSYGVNPYAGYENNDTPFAFTGDIDDRLFATEHVLSGLLNGEPMAYPFSILEQEGVVNDTVNAVDVVAFWQPGSKSALDRPSIDDSRDVGMAALYNRTVGDRVLEFTLGDDGLIRDVQTGSVWNVFGRATAGELEGTKLRPEIAGPHFWFAWAAFYPETGIYGQG